MIPVNDLLDAIAQLLADDTATLAPVSANHLHLAAAPFTPSASLLIGGLTEATFTGSAALNVGTGSQQMFRDPVTNQRIVQLLEPSGGWNWECTATPGAPETIYGYYLTDNADAVLLGSALLPAPITISAAGQGFSVPYVRFTFLNNSPA